MPTFQTTTHPLGTRFTHSGGCSRDGHVVRAGVVVMESVGRRAHLVLVRLLGHVRRRVGVRMGVGRLVRAQCEAVQAAAVQLVLVRE